MKNISLITKVLLGLGLLLVLWGYLSRAASLYFFWEAKSVGWAVILIGIIAFFNDHGIARAAQNKTSLPHKIGMGFILFVLLVQIILLASILYSDAYSAIQMHLAHNTELKAQLGEIKGISVMPTGSINQGTNSDGNYGSAMINLTVKGEKEYRDITLYASKSVEQLQWVVDNYE